MLVDERLYPLSGRVFPVLRRGGKQRRFEMVHDGKAAYEAALAEEQRLGAIPATERDEEAYARAKKATTRAYIVAHRTTKPLR